MTDNKFAFEFGDIGGFEWFADVGDCFDGVAFVADDVEVVVAVVVVVVSKSECLYKSFLLVYLHTARSSERARIIDDALPPPKKAKTCRSKGVCLSITPETRVEALVQTMVEYSSALTKSRYSWSSSSLYRQSQKYALWNVFWQR